MSKRKECKYQCGRPVENETTTRCRTCRRQDKKSGRVVRHDVAAGGPRILIIDIETSPNLADVWGLWNNNVSLNQLRESSRMMCFAAKWHGEPGTMFFSELGGHRDMVEAAWHLMDEADALMHFNGRRFDTKHLNREFLLAGLTPPSPYKQIDLLDSVKARFKFPSNKLQYVSTVLGLDGKVSHEGHELWVKCLAGDPEAWARMETYNRQDVDLLEEVFEILLPWIPGLPHRHLYGGAGCAACGHDTVVTDGVYRTPLSAFLQYRCTSCGHWMRDSKRLYGVEIQAAAL